MASTQSKKFPIKLRKKYPLIVSLVFILIIYGCYLAGMEINVTPSMPEGFYIKAGGKIKAGDIVSFCLDDPYKSLGLEQGYLEVGRTCHGSAPLIKQVLAVPGDDVLLADKYIQVNGVKYLYPTQHVDSEGRVLAVYPRGNYPDTSGYWLIGTHAANSWDSRYWGAVAPQQILVKVKPLLTW